ncbi:MAG: hypothetical protein LLF83_06115 [Methanobacterium sp.]|nr:hypothetical protein [Methanobacterium sp.]
MNDKPLKPADNSSRIHELEEELIKKESSINSIREKLNNNQEILQDLIQEKNLLKDQIQDFEIKQTNTKLQEYEKLQQNHHKLKHRLEVTKNHLDKANDKIKVLKERNKDLERIISDLHSRGLKDYLLRRYPDSYQEYEKE